MSIGLTPTGFVATTVTEEVTDLNAKFLANVDGSIDLAPDQPFGEVIGIFAEKFAELTELGATIYNMTNPSAAEGRVLVNIAAISGTLPQVATFSYVTGTLTLNAGTTVLAGAVASVAGQPTNRWVLTANVTNPGPGTQMLPGIFRSEQAGPFVANAGTLTIISTPTIGWTAITNAADAVPGLAADTDTSLRQKREAELAGQGSGDLDAIRAAVLKVPGVIQAFVFENVFLETDATGLPGKAFRVVVWDGVGHSASPAAIGLAIWKAKPTGILAYGATPIVVTDSQGNTHTVSFDYAQQKPLFVTLTTTPTPLTLAQRTAIRLALTTYADATFNLGVSIIDLPFRAAALVAGIDTDVPTFAFDFVASPVNTANLTVTGLQIATLDSTNIKINGTFA
jgi:hypothetical protein